MNERADSSTNELALHGVLLSGFAGIHVGLAEGFELRELLAGEGIDPDAWPAAERAWADRLAEAAEGGAAGGDLLQEAYDESLAAAQDRYGRRLPPSDEDLSAWMDFHRRLSLDANPPALLASLGVRPPEVARLHRAWSRRIAAEPALAEESRAILEREPGELPAPKPARRQLHVAVPIKTAEAPSPAPPLRVEAPAQETSDLVPPLFVPLAHWPSRPIPVAPSAAEPRAASPAMAPPVMAPPVMATPVMATPVMATPPATTAPPPVMATPPATTAPPPATAPLSPVLPDETLPATVSPLRQRPPPLPFAPAAPPPNITEQTLPEGPSPLRVALGAELPFAPARPTAPGADRAPRSPPIPVAATGATPEGSSSLDLEQTLMAAPSPLRGPSLPFKAADDPSERGTGPMPALKPRPALPFEREPPAAPAKPSAPPARAPAAFPALTLAQHASLSAEVAINPRSSDAIYERHGITTARVRQDFDAAWKERLSQQPADQERWRKLYESYSLFWAEQKRTDRG